MLKEPTGSSQKPKLKTIPPPVLTSTFQTTNLKEQLKITSKQVYKDASIESSEGEFELIDQENLNYVNKNAKDDDCFLKPYSQADYKEKKQHKQQNKLKKPESMLNKSPKYYNDNYYSQEQLVESLNNESTNSNDNQNYVNYVSTKAIKNKPTHFKHIENFYKLTSNSESKLTSQPNSYPSLNYTELKSDDSLSQNEPRPQLLMVNLSKQNCNLNKGKIANIKHFNSANFKPNSNGSQQIVYSSASSLPSTNFASSCSLNSKSTVNHLNSNDLYAILNPVIRPHIYDSLLQPWVIILK